MPFHSLAEAYKDGLHAVLSGEQVDSVLDPLSKASNFGIGNRPSRELLAHLFVVSNPANCLVSGPIVKLHLPYCFGLLAFSLSGDNRLETLRYYRPGAAEYSDDGWTLSGAFGSRLRGMNGEMDQLSAVMKRLADDPASRRTYSAIIKAEDNLTPSREYPCAAGVQLFLRNDRLTMLTVMRAQQAFTVLPYDAFLFMSMQLLLATQLGVRVGDYIHFSGTFHVYESEQSAIMQTLNSDLKHATLPSPPQGAGPSSEFIGQLINLESRLRELANNEDRQGLIEVASTDDGRSLLDVARRVLCDFALRKIGSVDEALAISSMLPSDIRALL
jgi:thymidylate synthase